MGEKSLDLIKPLLRSMREVHREMFRLMREEAESIGLTAVQLLTMIALTECPNAGLAELADRVQLTNSTVSGVIDRLESQRLVQRTRSDVDRRSVCLTLTDAGREKIQSALGSDSGFMQKMARLLEMPPEDIRQLIRLLDGMNRILTEARQDGGR